METAPQSHEAGAKPVRRRWSQAFRSTLGVCAVALLIHLVPLFLPRNMPEQELAIARATPNMQSRVRLLAPLKEHPKATGAELREAAELLLEEAPAEARELVEEAERREPGAVETQLLRARICRVERMERCVQESFERAVRMAPSDARPDLLWADLRENDGDTAAALEAVTRARSKAPGQTEIELRYARLLGEVGRHGEAVAVVQALSPKLSPVSLLLELGQAQLRAGRDVEARRLFAKAVGESPQSPVAHYHLGVAHFRLGDMDGAEEELRTADRLDVSNPRSLAALCAMQVKAGQLDAARVTKMDLERRFQDRRELIQSACRMSP
ncbi:tetratricopeptide repeat protein [Hyalangium rubrum]|uniref:Tetratricopeptide repeat protein n=1 Tax=Hyalangium rubrum TaxID=3103134 RepID=A0ABU5HB53_9BACT|nr:tetratricopeptide repeat protein [Hyalangium sp. s54d21]MDY7230319.1 tetratricopeptide repeat protein [Hyalangium sp. s54d21]